MKQKHARKISGFGCIVLSCQVSLARENVTKLPVRARVLTRIFKIGVPRTLSEKSRSPTMQF